jgi:hypothetical protein
MHEEKRVEVSTHLHVSPWRLVRSQLNLLLSLHCTLLGEFHLAASVLYNSNFSRSPN